LIGDLDDHVGYLLLHLTHLVVEGDRVHSRFSFGVVDFDDFIFGLLKGHPFGILVEGLFGVRLPGETGYGRQKGRFGGHGQKQVGKKWKLFVTLVTEVSLISREPNLRFERISISRGFL
jgi:hypothetical protein